MVFLCRRQSVSLNSIFIPLSPPSPVLFFIFCLSLHSMGPTEMYDIQMHGTVLEPAAPCRVAFAFCFQAELVSALLNNQWVSLQVINTSLQACYVYSITFKFVKWKTFDEGLKYRFFVMLEGGIIILKNISPYWTHCSVAVNFSTRHVFRASVENKGVMTHFSDGEHKIFL